MTDRAADWDAPPLAERQRRLRVANNFARHLAGNLARDHGLPFDVKTVSITDDGYPVVSVEAADGDAHQC